MDKPKQTSKDIYDENLMKITRKIYDPENHLIGQQYISHKQLKKDAILLYDCVYINKSGHR